MPEPRYIREGLKTLPKDERDFSSSRVFGSAKLPTLPPSLFVGTPFSVKDQGDSDFCTAYASTAANENHEVVELSPEYLFAQAKKLEGGYTSWGCDLRTVCKAWTKVGCIPQSIAPLSLKTHHRNECANWENWPHELDWKAAEHRQKSYVAISGPYDTFDNIRVSLMQHKDEQSPVLTGALWRQSWTEAPGGVIPKHYETQGFGHAFLIRGWMEIMGETMLWLQLSNGDAIGDKGFYYMPRSVANQELVFGNFQFVDMPKEKAATLNAWGTPSLGWLASLWLGIKTFFTP